jgi:hypothetical protein
MTIEKAREILWEEFDYIGDEKIMKIVTMLETIGLMLIENELSKK